MFGIIIYATPVFFLGFLAQIWIAPALGLPTSGRASPIVDFELSKVTHFYLIDSLICGQLVDVLGLRRSI